MAVESNQQNISDNTLSDKELLSSESLDALVVHNIIRTASKLSPYLNYDLRELELTSTQLNVLLLLHEAADEGLNLSILSRQLVVSKANVTGLIDRIERKGLICRNNHVDRRVTMVRLTEAGQTLIKKIMPEHLRLLGELTGVLDKTQKENLVQLLVRLRAGLRRSHNPPASPNTNQKPL